MRDQQRSAASGAPGLWVLLGLLVLASALVSVTLLPGQHGRPGGPDASDTLRRAASVADDRDAASGPAPGPGERARTVPRTRATAAAAALRAWDARRARAWAAGDPARLRALYVPGSGAGRRDIAMLSAWTGRGWRVRGLRTQVLAMRVLRDRDGLLVLRVTDRVVGAVAVRPGATEEIPLPRDRASERRVTLRRHGGRWRVAAVLPVGRGVPPAT